MIITQRLAALKPNILHLFRAELNNSRTIRHFKCLQYPTVITLE